MGYFPVIILALLIIVLFVVLVINSKRKVISIDKDIFDSVNLAPSTSKVLDLENIQEKEIITIEQLPLTTKIDDKRLFEITDNTVIARISETIPRAAEKIAKTINNKALKSVELYKAVIPRGETLVDSKQSDGAVRGFYRGTKGIKGHADLVKVDPTKVSKAGTMAKGVANVLNVGSLVVGQ